MSSRYSSFPLQAGQVDDFAGGVVVRDPHLEGAARVAEILSGEDGALLTDQQGSLGGYVSLETSLKIGENREGSLTL